MIRCREAWVALGNPEPPEFYLPPGCCISCHDDADEYPSTYPLMECTLPDGQTAEVCCHMLGLIDDAKREARQ